MFVLKLSGIQMRFYLENLFYGAVLRQLNSSEETDSFIKVFLKALMS